MTIAADIDSIDILEGTEEVTFIMSISILGDSYFEFTRTFLFDGSSSSSVV